MSSNDIDVSFDVDPIDFIDDADTIDDSLPVLLRRDNLSSIDEIDTSPERNLPDKDNTTPESIPTPKLGRGHRKRTKNKLVWNEDNEVADIATDPDAFLTVKPRLNTLDTAKMKMGTLNNAFLHSLDWDTPITSSSNRTTNWTKFATYISRHMDHDHQTWESPHPLLLSAKANDEDTPKWHQAMNGPYADKFQDACDTEIDTLKDLNTWEKVERESWMNVIKSTWAFKVKRYPSGLIRKFKARFCVRGDMQIAGVDFDETFAPVVNWVTVRTLLILSIHLNLSTAQLDYIAAFTQSDIKEDVYVEMPRGLREEGYVYKLNKCLYGLRQSPKNFFEHLTSQMKGVGFEPSKADPCLFIKDDCICISYVDDILIFAKNDKVIEKLILDLKEDGAQLNREDDVAGFLGVDIVRHDGDKIEMTQLGLTKKIVEALGLADCNPKTTPAANGTLPKDEFGEECDGTFNYASVLGMILYLQGHTRPNISFAVN